MTSSPTLFQKYSFEKVKQIWSGLPQDIKETTFKLENSEILSDLSNRANNARLTCQLDKNFKKKDLIIWEKDKEAMAHRYNFNFIRKDILKNSNLAELLSCFQLVINLNSSKQVQGSSSQTVQKSSLAVEKEKLDLFIEIMYRNSSIFNVSSKELFKTQSQSHVYSFLTAQFSEQFDDVNSRILQDLFSSILAIAVIFVENFSSFVFTTAAFIPALIPQKDISTQLNDLALILNTSQQPLSANIKSVTEIERTLHNNNNSSSRAESDSASVTHSNFSSSPRSTTSERKGSKDLVNELNYKVNNNSSRYHNRGPIIQQQQQGRFFERSTIMRSDIKSEPLYNRPRQLEDESPNNAFAIYNGLSVGDLTMDFKISDLNLILENGEDENSMANKVRARSGSGTLMNGDFISAPLLLSENHGHAHFYRQPAPHFLFPQQPHFGFYPIIYAPPPTNNLMHPMMNSEPIIKRANNHHVEASSNPESVSGVPTNNNNNSRKDGRERSIDSHSSQGSEKEQVKNTPLSSSSSYTGEVYNRNLVKEAEKLHSYPKDNNNKTKVRLPPRFKKLKD